MESYQRKRSWAWLLLPIFVQIIGGAIAYYALKPDEPRMAKDCLYIGITLTAINAATQRAALAIGYSAEEMFMPKFEGNMMFT